MQKIISLLKESIRLALSQPILLVFGFFQILAGICLVLIIFIFFKINLFLFSGFGFFCFLFSLVTFNFWRKIFKIKMNIKFFKFKDKTRSFFRFYLILLFGIMMLLFFKLSAINWSLLVLYSSLVVTSMVIILLAVTLFKFSFFYAMRLLISLWMNKYVFPSILTLGFMGINILTFLLGRILNFQIQGFPFSLSFGKISILVISAGLISVLVSILNIFLVLTFLEINKLVQAEKFLDDEVESAVTSFS